MFGYLNVRKTHALFPKTRHLGASLDKELRL
jgi:hypothetical protein